jgi:methionyl aminopeptidase
MSITNNEEFQKLKACGMIVAKALRAMSAQVRVGVTTAELSEIGAKVLAEHGARSSPPMVYGFPGDVCISVNDEVVHGIPGGRTLRAGDLLKLDLTAGKDGFHTDSAVSIEVEASSQSKSRAHELAHCAERAFRQALPLARAGNLTKDIGRAIEREVRRRGFCVVRELGGHGIGRTIHEDPSVPNWSDPMARDLLTEGLVVTVEPIIAERRGDVRLDPDGWTVKTCDGGLSAHYEHTIVITRGAPILLTAADSRL